MKQKVFLLTLLILLFDKYQAQVTNCNLSDVKGKTESIEISFFDVVKVDSAGNIIETKPRKSLMGNSYESYKFDSSGREIESIRKSSDSFINLHTTTYNDLLNFYVRRYFYRGNLQHIELVKLNINKQTDTVFNLDSDSSINSIEIKTYNQRGLLIEERKLDKGMQEISRSIFKYKLNGRLKKYTNYKNSKKEYTDIIKYRITYALYKRKKKGYNETIKHYYFKNKSVNHNKTRGEKNVNHFELDSFGNYVLSIDSLFIGGFLTRVTHRSYHYEYDSYGNWTRKVELVDGVPKMVAVRRYSYY